MNIISLVDEIELVEYKRWDTTEHMIVRARLVLSEYLTFSLQGFLATRQTAHAALD